ncbi:hypothetical protein HK104_010389 [Borealophlyctis nickersoniae]|nr:hypothetical protein HK104_010389 [Borealophlyctis nickersoniae]
MTNKRSTLTPEQEAAQGQAWQDDVSSSLPEPLVRIPLVAGVLLRLALILFTSAPALFADRVEASTPVTSFKRLQEGLHLFRNGIPPYNGGVYHQAPLLLALFHYIPPILAPFLFVLLDYATALCLVQIAEYKKHLSLLERWPAEVEVEREPGVQGGDDGVAGEETEEAAKRLRSTKGDPTRPVDFVLVPEEVGTLYLLNPYGIMACLAKSTQGFSSLAAVVGVYFALRGSRSLSMLSIAMAAYLSLYPSMLLAPCVLLLAQSTNTKIYETLKISVALFAGYLGGFLGISYLLIGSWDFLKSVYGVMEHPLFVVFLVSAISAIFKSYPSVADAPLYMAFLTIHKELYKYMRNLFLACSTLIYASLLGPLFFNLWLYAGSGNANFFYAITLVFALAQIILVTDAAHAMLRREWERMHPGFRKCRIEVVHK